MKIKLFTHNDWDGVSCLGILHFAYDNSYTIDSEMLNYGNVYSRLAEFFTEEKYIGYDLIYITDLSLNIEQEGRKELIDFINVNKDKFNLRWIDHHEGSNWFESYDWSIINYKDVVCGTSLLFKELKEKIIENIGYIPRLKEIENYVEMVNQYDTFNFKISGAVSPLIYNYYFKLIGYEEYCKDLLYKINFGGALLHQNEYKVGKAYLAKAENKIDKLLDRVIYIDINFEEKVYKAGIIVNDDYDLTSLLGNKICEIEYKERATPDLAMIFYPGGVALRSIGNKFNCDAYAKERGGGGHKNAAGYRTNNYDIEKMVIKEFLNN